MCLSIRTSRSGQLDVITTMYDDPGWRVSQSHFPHGARVVLEVAGTSTGVLQNIQDELLNGPIHFTTLSKQQQQLDRPCHE